MIRKIILIVSLTVIFIHQKVCSQDTAVLYFRDIKIGLPQTNICISFNSDSSYEEKILNVDNKTFIYIKARNKDSLIVEYGTLRKYEISNKIYLLRQGYWIIENSKVKEEFKNLAKIGIIDEIRVDSIQPQISDDRGKSKSKTKRKAQKM